MATRRSQDSAEVQPARAGAAERLLAQREQLLVRFVERTREEIGAMARQPHSVVVDTMPDFLKQLAEALSPDHPRTTAGEGSTLSQEHGGERMRLTDYRLDDLVHEYQILRDLLFEVLEEGGPLTAEERRTVLRSIDAAVAEACSAFFLVYTGLREQFVLTLTHDLRGPLSAARAAASLIQRRPDAQDVPRWAGRVVDNLERVERMVGDLLDVSHVGAGGRMALALAPCDLVALVRSVVEQQVTQHGDRFVLEAPDQLVGQWSADALRRAVENLVTNALKHGDPQRPVTVTLRTQHGRAVLSIHNFGVYIPAEEQESLFLAFRRSQDSQARGTRGWGLGLALVRAVAEAHGGSIGVESLPERGTTFALDLPLDARPFQTSPASPNAPEG